jgi:hypothetical protein
VMTATTWIMDATPGEYRRNPTSDRGRWASAPNF